MRKSLPVGMHNLLKRSQGAEGILHPPNIASDHRTACARVDHFLHHLKRFVEGLGLRTPCAHDGYGARLDDLAEAFKRASERSVLRAAIVP